MTTQITKNKGKVIWLYGRPCSGKTTLALSLAERLIAKGYPVITLDGDELREGINNDLGYSLEDRFENIRRASEIAKLIADKGFWVICSFVTPTKALRELVVKIIGESDLHLLYISASLEVCKQRDVKGHYLKAATNQLQNFTGIGSPFEEPVSKNNIIDTSELTIQTATMQCLDLVLNTSKVLS
jgi:adenylyl-sulfate kinase